MMALPPQRSATALDSRGLRRRIVGLLLAVSLLPLALLCAGAGIVFGRLLLEQALTREVQAVSHHAAALQRHLDERVRTLEWILRTRLPEELSAPGALQRSLDTLGEVHGGAFVDLGLLAADGRHVAYAGPYDLQANDYSGTDWFRSVVARGRYVSDVFLGYRGFPHCVVAVRRRVGDSPWVLRATIDSARFHGLVAAADAGPTGDTFLVNREGRLQTPRRRGAVLDAASGVEPLPHLGVRHVRVEVDGRPLARLTAWLNEERWMLVRDVDEAAVTAPVSQALASGAVVVLLAVALLVATTLLATSHLVARIDRASAQRDALSHDLMRSARLASLGELATGLAHEINNPLAILSAEQTNLGDELDDLGSDFAARPAMLRSLERCRRQVERCAGITAKILQFGRRRDPRREPTDVLPRLREAVSLLQRGARERGIALSLEADPDLPPLLLDATELEQVLVNLVHNALAASEPGGSVLVTARQADGHVVLEVVDEGCGIPPEHLDSVFLPFFTTKPPGQGTGLGLSVSHGLVRGWGATIDVDSEPGRGTRMRVRVPAAANQGGSHGGS